MHHQFFFTPLCRHKACAILSAWFLVARGFLPCISALEARRKQYFWLSHCDQNCQILSKKYQTSFCSKRLIYILLDIRMRYILKLQMAKWKWLKILSVMELEAKARIWMAKWPHSCWAIFNKTDLFGLFWLSRTYLRQRPNHQQHCTSLSLPLQASLNKNIIINILTTGNIWKKLRNIPAPPEFFRQIEALQQSQEKLIMEQKLEQSINSDYQYVYQS